MRCRASAWVTIAESKDDYAEDVVIQQGIRATIATSCRYLRFNCRAAAGAVRYVTVEVEQFKSARTVDFALLGTGEQPKRFSAVAEQSGGERQAPMAPQRSTGGGAQRSRARPGGGGSRAKPPPHFTARIIKRRLRSDEATAKRKSVGRLNKNTPVRVEERTEFKINNRTVEWVKVVTRTGAGGWLQGSELAEMK
jgi:hypothetical protein